MAKIRQDLQPHNVWRTCAILRQLGTGISAMIKSEGDVPRIFVRIAP